MATHSSTLVWKIPWMEEPGTLQSMGSQSRTQLSDFTFFLSFFFSLFFFLFIYLFVYLFFKFYFIFKPETLYQFCQTYSAFWRGKWQPTPVFLPGESHGWRGLVGYGLWGCRELDTTEQLTHTHTKFPDFGLIVLQIGFIFQLFAALRKS